MLSGGALDTFHVTALIADTSATSSSSPGAARQALLEQPTEPNPAHVNKARFSRSFHRGVNK